MLNLQVFECIPQLCYIFVLCLCFEGTLVYPLWKYVRVCPPAFGVQFVLVRAGCELSSSLYATVLVAPTYQY